MDNDVKAYKSYADQVQILEDRGMDMGDRESAAEILKHLNYYRLSGYWYPFRKLSGGPRHTYGSTSQLGEGQRAVVEFGLSFFGQT